MDTDKIKIFGARVKVDGTGKLAELERAEKVWSSQHNISRSDTVLGQDEGQGGIDCRSWHQRIRQPAVGLQLPRIAICRSWYHVHRTRRF